MRLRLFLLALMCLIIAAAPARADGLAHGNFTGMQATGSATVEQVIDPLTMRLNTKQIVRLSGIEYPDFNPNAAGPVSVMAMKILKDMLEGKMVSLYQTDDRDSGLVNRMGQQLVQMEVQKGNIWVQGAILQLGLARVMTDARNPDMAGQMYKIEDRARAARAGIWALDQYKVLTADEAKDHIGSVQIVQGRVRSSMMLQNRIYLNFGGDWRSDFTISIASENRRAFFDRNIDPLKWNGRLVRVRGWIGDYNGPFIEADHPEQIEVLDDAPDTDSQLKVAPQEPMVNPTDKN